MNSKEFKEDYTVLNGGGIDIVIPKNDPWFNELVKEYPEYSEKEVKDFLDEIDMIDKEDNGEDISPEVL